uniref:NHL repeat-containing protein 2 n=1 Tax=Noccaea caerulescens TaxID=107243 RepID=A0A1J3HBR0_NOCCA
MKANMSSTRCSRSSSVISIILAVVLVGLPIPSSSTNRHVINFRSPGLYPEGLTYDPSGQHFIVGSLHTRTIHSVSDAGVIQTIVSDPDLPENATILGLAVDSTNRRLLAAIHCAAPLLPFSALAAYDLRSGGRRIFLSPLPSLPGDDEDIVRDVANDVAVDYKGNAYVTNSAKNFIWKVNRDGVASIFSRSPIFNSQPVAAEADAGFRDCGLNGILYISKGYLLVVQTNTGKMFKVDEESGTARLVLLNGDLVAGDGMARKRRDGTILVVSQKKLWFLKSQDSWSEGVIYDETDLDVEGFPTAVTVAGQDRIYVLYGRVMEGIMGTYKEGEAREWFGIEEVSSEKESGEDKIWLYVLIGFGFAYFCFWRFQMKKLITNMDKKTT